MLKRLTAAVVLFTVIFAAPCAFAAGREIVKFYADADVSKDMIVDDVVVVGGNATVSGRVNNGIVVVGGSAELKPGAYVAEHVVVVGGKCVKDPAAHIGGKISEIDIPHFIPSSLPDILKGGWMAMWATISLLVLLGFLGLAILLIALIPKHMTTVLSAIQKSFIMMLLWGILWMVLVVPIAVLLAISIIGILLIPLEMLLAALALIIGYIASAIFIGKHILQSFKKTSTHLFVDAIIGILVLFAVGLVPIVGHIVKVLFLVAGFGAVITTRFGTTR
ncbi:MAG: hypothetical protein PHX20_05095 [Candidatus Omnitrophica bacterium]|nr:hypothetical protein [Candidatus Omnitrophota bacterium]MDD5436900.1 hypothetical protein [Candidatus Omnitrophota bacterium]